MSKDRPINRRAFFRQGLGELLRPLADAAGPLQEMIRQINSIDMELQAAGKAALQPTAPAPPEVRGVPDVWHRPPGALPEAQFRQACSKCGECVRVCPVQCIKIDTAGAKGAGVPFIDIDAAPCVMCAGLYCMHNCPTGALVPTPIGEIDMGTAVWHENLCLRTQGQECTICVDECPIGEVAIRLNDNKVEVIEAGCTGCGVCQNRCPTHPKSITVTTRPSGGPVSRTSRR